MGFHDHFSGHAESYARHRPTYPAALFSWLAGLTDGHALAWDCATGNGQAAVQLAVHYASVLATDASEQQLSHRQTHRQVQYRVEPAEECSAGDASVDLVTVAQALHWLDLARFYAEVRRVIKPRGVVAAWGYGLATITPEVDQLVRRFYQQVEDFWPPERRLIEQRYRTLAFPFDELDVPEFAMETEWTLDQHLSYLRTWSATRRAEQATGRDPVLEIEPELRRAWGGGNNSRRVRWPMCFRVGRGP